MDEYDAIAFGCPALGAEELEESEFGPMFTSCEEKLAGKKIALFGSYGWGDGEWMRNSGRITAGLTGPIWHVTVSYASRHPMRKAFQRAGF